MYIWLTVYLGTDGKVCSMRILMSCDWQPLNQVLYNTGPCYEQLLWAVSHPAARITVAQLWAAPKGNKLSFMYRGRRKVSCIPRKACG